MNFLEDEKGKSIESNVVQKLCNETRNTMNLSCARITSIDYTPWKKTIHFIRLVMHEEGFQMNALI